MILRMCILGHITKMLINDIDFDLDPNFDRSHNSIIISLKALSLVGCIRPKLQTTLNLQS